jgi:molybdate transport system ATP-binding protein
MLNLDLTARRGTFELRVRADIGDGVTAILGPSGSGKSTLLALIAGLLRPDSGSVRFTGETLTDASRGLFVPAWQRHFGLVFQDGQLFPHLSVRSNLRYGYQKLPPEKRRLAFETVIDLLEIGALLNRRPAQLSGGERQRVALGRALLYSPRLLLLDEPLASLDVRLKEQILPFLRRVKDEIGIPMVFVTHAANEAEYLADRILPMWNGQLAPGPETSKAPSRPPPE